MTEAGIRACVDAGAGAVVAKSINEDPRAAQQLDMARYTLLDDSLAVRGWPTARRGDSLFNQSGLAQAALPEWLAMLERCESYAATRGSRIIGSVTVAGIEGAAHLAHEMSQVVSAVEINLSAPHGREAAEAVRQVTTADAVGQYTRAVRDACSCPLIIKLSAQADDVVLLARRAAEAGADAVTLTGRYQGFVPDLETQLPVLGSWGAIGGSWALPLSLYWVSKAHLAMPDLPLVGTNGARDGDDVLRFLLSGARAVELASAVLTHGPAVLTQAVARVASYLDGARIEQVGDLVGRTARAARSYAQLRDERGAQPGDRPWQRFLTD